MLNFITFSNIFLKPNKFNHNIIITEWIVVEIVNYLKFCNLILTQFD